MSRKPIRLSIQEIVSDFEDMIRTDENINILADFGKLDESDCRDYHKRMLSLAEKYMPMYIDSVPAEYLSDEA